MTPIELESECMQIKAALVRILSEFREKRPKHEFTSIMAKAEESIYKVSEEVQRLRIENEDLKRSIEMMDSQEDSYIEQTEEIDTERVEPISEEDWLRKPMQSKDKPNF